MKQLSIVAALFNQSEIDADPKILDNWPTAYIVDNHGHIFTHRKLGGGGHVTLKSKERPERLKDVEQTFSEVINHLPGGKIPLEMFSQICSFFKKVMKDKGYDKSTNVSASTGWRASNEAMAHILWNTETKQYEIGIPTQKVSTAAVDFSYDDVKEHHIIVVDVHSHNNMSAFWSPRDDKEDAKGIWYSGVVGTIDKGPTTNWRFSMNGEFRSMKFEDIYNGEFKDVQFDLEVPEEWMDKVSQYVYTASTYQYPRGNTYQGGSTTGQGSGYQGYGGYNNLDYYRGLYGDLDGLDDWFVGAKRDQDEYDRKGNVVSFGKGYQQSYHNITFAEMRDEMNYHLSEMARMGNAATANNIYRPRIQLSKAELGQALFTVLESFSDEDLDVAFNAIAKSFSGHRRSKVCKHKARVLLRRLDGILDQAQNEVRPSHITR